MAEDGLTVILDQDVGVFFKDRDDLLGGGQLPAHDDPLHGLFDHLMQEVERGHELFPQAQARLIQTGGDGQGILVKIAAFSQKPSVESCPVLGSYCLGDEKGQALGRLSAVPEKRWSWAGSPFSGCGR